MKRSSVQFSHSVLSDSLWPHRLQRASLPCPSPSPGVCSNSCQLSRWCHPAISSSVVPFSSCLQSFPASGSFPMSQLFTSGGQRIAVSPSASMKGRWCPNLLCPAPWRPLVANWAQCFLAPLQPCKRRLLDSSDSFASQNTSLMVSHAHTSTPTSSHAYDSKCASQMSLRSCSYIRRIKHVTCLLTAYLLVYMCVVYEPSPLAVISGASQDRSH